MGNANEAAAAVYYHSPLAMTITDKEKRIVSVNSAFCDITGYQEQDVIGLNPNILSSGKHNATFYKQMWQQLNLHHRWSGEIWNKRKNGEIYLEKITISTITDDDNEIKFYFAIFSDITERKSAEEAIYKLTYHDELTSLPNRRFFMERLEKNIQHADIEQQLLAVLFIDIDNFKDINDSLGHDRGDLIIKEIADRLGGLVRDTDCLARLGGDEFTICLNDIKSTEAANTVAQSILKAISHPFHIETNQLFLYVSIGIALYPDNALTVTDLLKYADQALFTAKTNGRNKVSFFNQSMHEQVTTKQELSTDLHQALARNELSIHYQPIINMVTGEINKAEALLRWNHPQRGSISPAEFIPVAEDYGMITEIGDWVFEQATQVASRLQKKHGIHFQISINKSPKQFENENDKHLDWYKHLREISLNSSSVVVEITEGLLLDNDSFSTEQLLSFRAKGIQLAIDDFGTGYSSLAYLKKFDIDYLKIDRSFVRDLKEGSQEQALCEAIIVMAHKLDIKVIAEGIETDQQRVLLLMAGCDYGQGYLFSKPLPLEQFEKLLAEQLS